MTFRELIEKGGEAPGEMEVSVTSLEDATMYFKKELEKLGLSLDDIQNFESNYSDLKNLVTRYGKTKRKDMPVVSWSQIKDFQNKLINGELDIKKPFNKEVINSIGKFPNKIKKSDRSIWLDSGKHDGASEDDKIDAKLTQIKARDLKPIQEQLYLSKAIKNYARGGFTKQDSEIVKRTLIVDADNMIIDGHHRWLTVFLSNPNIKLNVLKVDLNLKTLLKLTKSYGVSVGNTQNS